MLIANSDRVNLMAQCIRAAAAVQAEKGSINTNLNMEKVEHDAFKLYRNAIEELTTHYHTT